LKANDKNKGEFVSMKEANAMKSKFVRFFFDIDAVLVISAKLNL